jgi:hypothetical protein
MIETKRYMPDDVVDQTHLKIWRQQLKEVVHNKAENCPLEVRQFIDAVADKLPAFGQIRKDTTMISGYELQLCGMKEFNGERINVWEVYELPVPHMIAVDHYSAMHRLFHKKGKQGLIDYCRARVKGTELEKLLNVLNVHVFKEEREEFKKVMEEINRSRQLEVQL